MAIRVIILEKTLLKPNGKTVFEWERGYQNPGFRPLKHILVIQKVKKKARGIDYFKSCLLLQVA